MKKYIDADELKKVFRDTEDAEYARWTLAGVLYEIDDIEAADVQEVKHGRWAFKFYCGNMSGYDYGMNCSVCGKPTHRQFAEKMPPYCPNCGASMDEVTE